MAKVLARLRNKRRGEVKYPSLQEFRERIQKTTRRRDNPSYQGSWKKASVKRCNTISEKPNAPPGSVTGGGG